MIGRKSVVVLITGLIADVLGFIGLIAITHSVGKDGYGMIAFSQALVVAFASVADLGFSQAHIKRVSEGRDINECISTFTAVKLALIAVFVAVTLLSLLTWTELLGGTISSVTLNLVLLFLLYYVLYQVASIVTVTYAGTMEPLKANLVVLADPLIRVPLILFFAFGSLGVISIAYAFVLGALGVLFAALFFIWRDRPKWRGTHLFRSYLAFAKPIAIITIVAGVTNQIFVVVIGLAGASGQAGFGGVGLYSGCLAILSVFALFGTAVSAMTFPSFSKMHTDGEIEQIRRLTYQAERYVSMIGLPVTAVIVLFPSQVAHILLGFTGAGDDMRLLALATFIGMLNSAHGSQIYAVNRPDIGAKLTFLGFALSIILSLLLIPQSIFGVPLAGLADEGAAIAYLAVGIVGFALTRWIVHRLTRTAPNLRLGIHLLAVIVTAIAVSLLSLVMPITSLVTLIAMGLFAYAVFVAALYLLREFRKEDLDYFLDLVNPRKMWRYMREELRSKQT